MKRNREKNEPPTDPEIMQHLKAMHPLQLVFFCENVLRGSHHNA